MITSFNEDSIIPVPEAVINAYMECLKKMTLLSTDSNI